MMWVPVPYPLNGFIVGVIIHYKNFQLLNHRLLQQCCDALERVARGAVVEDDGGDAGGHLVILSNFQFRLCTKHSFEAFA